jgi:predicted secreted Zn-dependent protease
VDARTPPKVRQEFDRLFKKLMLHEEGHEQLAVDFAKRFEPGILALPTEPNCPRMGEVANALRDSLLSSPVGWGQKIKPSFEIPPAGF